MNYGEESFNLAKGPNNEQYIIRDLNKEQNIENVLNRHSFYRDKGKFIFNGDDDKLYEFLLSDLKDVKSVERYFILIGLKIENLWVYIYERIHKERW